MRLWNMDSGDAGPAFAMNGYDKETLALINQMLGEGEVAFAFPSRTKPSTKSVFGIDIRGCLARVLLP